MLVIHRPSIALRSTGVEWGPALRQLRLWATWLHVTLYANCPLDPPRGAPPTVEACRAFS
jgi:hypothetical protein